MSTMLLSLVLQVRDEASKQIAKLREEVVRAQVSARGTQAAVAAVGRSSGAAGGQAQSLAHGLAVAAVRARELGRNIAIGAGIATAGLAASLKGALDVGLDNERLEERLRGVEETEGRAKAALAVVREFRSKTAFVLGDVAESWIELRKRAMAPTGVTMAAIADAAAATGKSMANASEAVARFAQGGGEAGSALEEFGITSKVQGQSLILTYQYLGKVMREIIPKDNKLLVQNKLVEILGKKFEGSALRAASSWSGLMLRMREGFQEFALEVMDKGGVLGALKAEVDSFLRAGDGEGNKTFGQVVATGLKELIKTVGEAVRWLQSAIPKIREFVSAIGGIKTVAAGVLAILAAPFVAALLNIAMTISGPVITALRLLSVALLTTPAGLIISLIAALIYLAWQLYENWDNVSAALVAVWDWIKAQALAFWHALQGDVAIVANAFVSSWETVRAFFANLWADIKAGFDATFGAIARGIAEVRSSLPSLTLGDVKLPTMAGISASINNAARSLVDGVLKVEIDVRGNADAKVTEARMKGPIDLDASLGLSMVSP